MFRLKKQRQMIFIVIGLQVIYALAYIYQATRYVGALYHNQKLEQQEQKLIERKRSLDHQLLLLQSRSSIREFAKNKLGLQPIKLKEVKRLDALKQQ